MTLPRTATTAATAPRFVVIGSPFINPWISPAPQYPWV